MVKGNGVAPSEELDFRTNSCTGEARRPKESHSVFREALGLSGDESDEQWAQIKKSVHEILLNRGLVGRMPSLVSATTKTAIAKELEAAHIETFSQLQPTRQRRDLINRIFRYQMTGLRSASRRSGMSSSLQQTPSPLGTPSRQEASQKFTPVGSLKAESSTRGSAVAPSMVDCLAVGLPPLEILEDTVGGAVALESSGTQPFGAGRSGAEYLPMRDSPGAREMPLASVPVPLGHKDIIITILVPSVPGFKTMLIQRDLLEASTLSMSKLFRILREDGVHCRPEDYVVHDQFGNKLVSDRHLAIAFQLLSNEGRLESQWLVLRKGEEVFPSHRPSPPAPAMTPNIPGPSEKGFSIKQVLPNPDSTTTTLFTHLPSANPVGANTSIFCQGPIKPTPSINVSSDMGAPLTPKR